MIPAGNIRNIDVKGELCELIDNMVNGHRTSFHMYTIHRLMSLSLLNSYEFKYLETPESDWIRVQITFDNEKSVKIGINTCSQYGQIEDEDSLAVLKELSEHKTSEEGKGTVSKGFLTFSR
ncbi:hypothetical protein BigBertha_65 [Bacillus phage BigBertha]|uniref:Uncharacterized protein n=6 Tax=Caudoviricetes TaxID=2731619 RepID=A0A7U3T8L3_9CAUD|nr:hypothetical protein TROLL_68 [Bacillus phage Troll]YP_008771092.1 hypothetical protein BigBertha_65 [Bacillus phage BigBertha]YP_009206421.1 hypothetical protein AVV02_gp066 [Bacillus phage AvesoBmore]YP_009289944.1 hypothetical protein BI003_gp065 [Bacillus phage Phrodo]AMW61497.1 hypothetical protein JUGLONE_64 [Bacillus phage Juglone]QDH49755.1 hypothetical protein BEYONPHE_68 [Bacillus phage Beyonphe]QPY77300.1 hypothetical protein ANTHOS_63 [Bacillus phage Anthos]UGO48877.1 hypothet